MMLSTLLQCCIVIVMQIKLTVVVVVVVVVVSFAAVFWYVTQRLDDIQKTDGFERDYFVTNWITNILASSNCNPRCKKTFKLAMVTIPIEVNRTIFQPC